MFDMNNLSFSENPISNGTRFYVENYKVHPFFKEPDIMNKKADHIFANYLDPKLHLINMESLNCDVKAYVFTGISEENGRLYVFDYDGLFTVTQDFLEHLELVSDLL